MMMIFDFIVSVFLLIVYLWIGLSVNDFSEVISYKPKYNFVRILIILFWPIYLVWTLGRAFIEWLFTKE